MVVDKVHRVLPFAIGIVAFTVLGVHAHWYLLGTAWFALLAVVDVYMVRRRSRRRQVRVQYGECEQHTVPEARVPPEQ